MWILVDRILHLNLCHPPFYSLDQAVITEGQTFLDSVQGSV